MAKKARNRKRKAGPAASAGRRSPRQSGGSLAHSSRAARRQSARASRMRWPPILVFLACLGAYLSNGGFMYGGDQEGNMLFSVNLLKRHSFSLGPPDAPGAFQWALQEPGEELQHILINEWHPDFNDWYQQGKLKVKSLYYLVESDRQGVFVNVFGMGASIVGLPVYALLDLFTDIETDYYWYQHGGALTASLLTAATALLIFLMARRFVAPWPAALAALAFGLGSCAWSVSSQALWQHPVNSFFLALGAYFLIALPERPRCAAYCGAALGMAVLCRPPSALVAICIGGYLLWTNRRALVPYVAGGLPFALILAAYNNYYFGSPFEFGQTVASKAIALQWQGSEDLWSAPLWESLPGLFISPSRGLAFYSPVLLFAFWGAAVALRTPRYRPLLPLFASAALLIVVAAKWWDWFGGTCYGYRSIVDAAPFLTLLLIPVIERIVADRRLLGLFAGLLLWSGTVQFVGAYAYNAVGWNQQWAEYENPDKASLWRWDHPQFLYHIVNFESEWALKRRQMRFYESGGPYNHLPILNLQTQADG